jgi:5-formyltetrahydrofolate cyclo-ligase
MRKAGSDLVCRQILGSNLWRQAGIILFYAPMPDELDVSPLWPTALAEGKILCLPRFDPASDRYTAAHVVDLARDLTPGRYGVREPVSSCPSVPLNRLDLTLVPGLAFGPNGRRLGRGRGYYDRLLAETNALKCGIGFDVQWLDSIPREPCDVLLDCILTPGRGFVWSSARI